MVGAANHVRDAHVDVIHDGAELVSWRAHFLAFLGRTQENEILDLFVGHFARAEHRVIEFRHGPERNAEANRGVPDTQPGLAFPAGATRYAPRPRIFFCVLGFFDGVAAGIFFRRTIAEISRA